MITFKDKQDFHKLFKLNFSKIKLYSIKTTKKHKYSPLFKIKNLLKIYELNFIHTSLLLCFLYKNQNFHQFLNFFYK